MAWSAGVSRGKSTDFYRGLPIRFQLVNVWLEIVFVRHV
jgi:hypothetical protein